MATKQNKDTEIFRNDLDDQDRDRTKPKRHEVKSGDDPSLEDLVKCLKSPFRVDVIRDTAGYGRAGFKGTALCQIVPRGVSEDFKVEMSISYGYYSNGPVDKATMSSTCWTVGVNIPLSTKDIGNDGYFSADIRGYYRKALVEKAIAQNTFLKNSLLDELFEPLEEEVVKLYKEYKSVMED